MNKTFKIFEKDFIVYRKKIFKKFDLKNNLSNFQVIFK